MNTKLKAIYMEMEIELKKFPSNVDVTSKPTAIAINQILDKFKGLTSRTEKITKKYLPGQEILTIDYEYYDTLEEYYIYLLRNSSRIEQGLKEITKHTEEYL